MPLLNHRFVTAPASNSPLQRFRDAVNTVLATWFAARCQRPAYHGHRNLID